MTDSTDTTSNIVEQPEVEGHLAKVRYEPAAEVEGHAKRFFKRGEDAEAPADESRDSDEPEVEGHGSVRFK